MSPVVWIEAWPSSFWTVFRLPVGSRTRWPAVWRVLWWACLRGSRCSFCECPETTDRHARSRRRSPPPSDHWRPCDRLASHQALEAVQPGPQCACLLAATRTGLGLVRCYLTLMRTTISTKGQIVLPAELRVADDIKAGEEFEVDRVGPDEYRLTRLAPPPNRGLVDWLRSCPEDGCFVEIESESTDSL